MNDVYEEGSVFNLPLRQRVLEAERLGIGADRALRQIGERAGRSEEYNACGEHARVTMELYED